jgi:hypothetical protein
MAIMYPNDSVFVELEEVLEAGVCIIDRFRFHFRTNDELVERKFRRNSVEFSSSYKNESLTLWIQVVLGTNH